MDELSLSTVLPEKIIDREGEHKSKIPPPMFTDCGGRISEENSGGSERAASPQKAEESVLRIEC